MARKIRNDIFELYSVERSNGDVHKLYNRFKENLIHDLKPEEFADTYAQTIVYGLFSARIKHKEDYTIENISNIMPRTNPFLRELFIECFSFGSKKKALIDFTDLELDDMVDAFKIADIENIIHDFGRQTGGGKEDPVIHFYELFMKEYDPEQKIKRGEFYTPDPVVSFIVRSVDYILKNEFGYEDGLADTEKMEVEVTIKDKNGREKKIKEKHSRVNMLDFATGTGTFLKHSILQIKSNFDEKNKSLSKEELKVKWNEYVNNDLLSRLNGFELKMAPYSIAHFNLGLVLEQTGYAFKGSERLNVFLTNTLEESGIKESLFDDFISKESHEAGLVKNKLITVNIGNPPYSVSSSNKIGFVAEELMSIYKTAVKDERNIQPLSDDYIKFIRFAHWKMEKINKGVIGIITNNSFLDGIIHRGMREELTKTFDEIYILNLHGNSNIGETCSDGSKDDNVFDIRQGVSIAFFVKTGKDKNENRGVYYYSLQGLREKKYEFLYKNNVKTIKWEKLKCDFSNFWFKKKDLEYEDEYYKNLKIDEIFNNNSVGVVTGDDEKKILLKNKTKTIFYYRPFDFRYIDFKDKTLQRPRLPFMFQYNKDNVGLLVCKQYKNEFNHSLITSYANSKHIIGDAAYNFPLYFYDNEDDFKTPNLNMVSINDFTQKSGLKFKDHSDFKNLKGQKDNTFSPIDLLEYIYAVLHSPSYREKYKEFLKIDFPRIPYPKDKDTFWKLVEQGGYLSKLHLLESPLVDKFITKYPVKGSNQVYKVKYEDCKVFINEDQYFDKVPEVAWEFYIGGYQPAQKWLKDRKGRNLTEEDIEHYQKVIVALTETVRIMKEIDKLTREWV